VEPHLQWLRVPQAHFKAASLLIVPWLTYMSEREPHSLPSIGLPTTESREAYFCPCAYLVQVSFPCASVVEATQTAGVFTCVGAGAGAGLLTGMDTGTRAGTGAGAEAVGAATAGAGAVML
jgi:hypothetical protein